MVCLWSGTVLNHSRVFRKVSPDFRLLKSAHTQLFRDNSLINLYLTELYILFMMVKVDPQSLDKLNILPWLPKCNMIQLDVLLT